MTIISKPASAEYNDGWERIFARSAALKAYWSAKTPEAERAAYARMMELGMPDSYHGVDLAYDDSGGVNEC